MINKEELKAHINKALESVGMHALSEFSPTLNNAIDSYTPTPQFITGDAIKDAPTGLYRVHYIYAGICNAVIYRERNQKLYLVDSGGERSILEHRRIAKLEPLHLDYPIKQEPVPEVGKWYWVRVSSGSSWQVGLYIKLNRNLIFRVLNAHYDLSEVYSWHPTPIELPEVKS